MDSVQYKKYPSPSISFGGRTKQFSGKRRRRPIKKRSTWGRITMKATRRALGHSLVRTLICLLRTARFARALRCTHSLACFAFASMEISLEHTLCRVCSVRSSICKKIVFDFFFAFAFASTEFPLEDRQRRVRF